MHRKLISELTLFNVIVCLVHSKEYGKLYCPNSQLPEMDNNGAAKQCLPGHEELCGPGYSCYFSGTNYQCCPSDEEINLNSILECPPPSITILTDAGLPLICTPGLHNCPQSSMQCLNVGKHSICCEELSSIIEQSQEVHAAKELNLLDETAQPIALSNELFNVPTLECPEPAFTILDSNGDPVSCNEEDCTHQAGRFCYKQLNIPICCEGERATDDDTLIKKITHENNEKEGRIGWSILKYEPLRTAQRQLKHNSNHLGVDGSNVDKAQILDGSASEIMSPLITDGLDRNSGGNQISNKNSQQSVISANAEALQTITTTTPITANTVTTNTTTPTSPSTTTTTTTTATAAITSTEIQLFGGLNEKIKHQSLPALAEDPQEDKIGTIRYKPHNAGGYAVSRVFTPEVHRAPDNLRALAREYLLEHIRRGWPYSDEFYSTQSESQPDQDDQIIFHRRT
ncbi:unnamed protein product [Litomosoides sigmodontis]|uniref:Uncharacterized protein n=1 Tax=Litomosoides sigmodontis TaxID=42156 RepID=A0A3P6TNT7_LITSI|nr:unnamed protein product [Litomosoides sigmodontis]